MFYRLASLLIIIIILLCTVQSPMYAWFNRGLDDTLVEMRKLFNQRELVQLYDNYVHNDIKDDIIKLIIAMKTEKTDEYKLHYD